MMIGPAPMSVASASGFAALCVVVAKAAAVFEMSACRHFRHIDAPFCHRQILGLLQGVVNTFFRDNGNTDAHIAQTGSKPVSGFEADVVFHIKVYEQVGHDAARPVMASFMFASRLVGLLFDDDGIERRNALASFRVDNEETPAQRCVTGDFFAVVSW